MSLSTYFDYIHTLLPDDQREAYKACATTGVMRSITRAGHRSWSDTQNLLESQGWIFSKPQLGVADNHWLVDREDRSVALGHHRGHQGGWYYIQESAASLPATLIDYKPDDVILDICAAPGGKTSQLASNLLKLGGSGFVVANEIDNVRRSTLKENITRMGLHNVTITYRHSSRWAQHYPNTFDHIVVDAPCSGEGTIFRTIDFMDQRGIGLTHKNAEIQKQIVGDAITCLKPGGTLVYSTCTLNTNENEGVVSWILEQYGDQMSLEPVNIQGSSQGLPGFGLSDEDCTKVARFRPHIQKTGGFWVSKFRKVGVSTKAAKTIEHTATSGKQLITEYGITLPHCIRIYEDKGIGYLTTTQKLVGFESGLAILKLGHLSTTPLQSLVPALGHLSSRPRIGLSNEQIQQWIMSTELEIDTNLKGRVIVSCNGFDVGLGKVGGGVLKNKM